ncbi:MAG: FTR1 family protein [Verrucomicrobiae bacterium]|nr:FTR1 family protein [Verrucomicrobiae bacterium]
MIYLSRISRFLKIVVLGIILGPSIAHADIMDDYFTLQAQLDDSLLNLYGNQASSLSPKLVQKFYQQLRHPSAQQLANQILTDLNTSPLSAPTLGQIQANLQHILALEMIQAQRQGDIPTAQQYRALIKLPKYANATEGALSLKRMGKQTSHQDTLSQLLAKEYLTWQTTRIREKLDTLNRLTQQHPTFNLQLLQARTVEIQTLSQFPSELYNWAFLKKNEAPPASSQTAYLHFLQTLSQNFNADFFSEWKKEIETSLPNLLTADDINRRERLLLKLLRLIPMEYQSGVRNGEITVPLEYREAETFTRQSRQILDELLPTWRNTKTQALNQYGTQLTETLQSLENAIAQKQDPKQIEILAKNISQLLQKEFQLTLLRSGKSSDVIEETVLEVRSLLTQSLQAAQAARWNDAKNLRLEAYTTFDLEIEKRTLPRDPELALRAEHSFLEGTPTQPGIKAALDARVRGEALTQAYAQTLAALEECHALLKVNLSPTAAIYTTITIITREGLEAVVILAALLAGLRGPANQRIRHRVINGAWLALGTTVLTFWLSRSLIESLSRYGEKLEAVISIFAVIILLMVTNWVFHKVYWVQWNARLRSLSKAVQDGSGSSWESLALIGVGFMTIYREGFETSLFLQSLILEAGMRTVGIGVLIGCGIIALLGWIVFAIGAHLPYRKLLVFTGILVVSILLTFIGSTVRLFQTVGWLSIHPISSLEIPSWMGVWLGLYPSWEGMLLPVVGIGYVAVMWFYVKITSLVKQRKMEEKIQSDITDPSDSTLTTSVV